MKKFLDVAETGEIHAPVSVDSPVLKIDGNSVADLLNQKADSGNVSNDILHGQILDSGITSPAPVYFDSGADMWKLFTPSLAESEKVAALYTGSNTVALQGAIVDMTYDSDYLFIGDNGGLQTEMNTLSVRNVIAYRVGPAQFKVGHSKQDYRLKKFCDKIQYSTANENDYFGCSVSICDDVAIVGAFGEESGTDLYGAAFIFRYDGENWIEEQKLVPSDAGQMGYFGYTSSISGDVAIVGAMYASKAFIFRYNGTTWTEEQAIQGSDTGPGDMFSSTVSISGDTAFVGSGKNACYVFKYNGTSWVEEQILQSSDIEAGDYFGMSVAVSGDVAAVGAFGETSGAGAVYIFRYNGTSWIEEQKFTASDAEGGDNFGYPVSISGDVVAVGVRNEDTGGSDAGAVYIFRHNGTAWTEEQKLMASDAEAGDGFGCAVSLSGSSLVVGANTEDDYGTDAGAAYIFKYDGSTWTEEKKILSEDIEGGDNFGMSVAISGDAAVVGALYEDANGSQAGAAYIFGLSCEPETLLQDDILMSQKVDSNVDKYSAVYYDTAAGIWKQYIPGAQGRKKVPALYMGESRVALNGAVVDFDFEGDILFIDDEGELKPYLQTLSTRKVLGHRIGQSSFKIDFDEYDYRLKQVCEKIQSGDKAADDWFGWSVAVSGDAAIVGAYRENGITGAAYIFRYNGTAWEEEAKLGASDAEGSDCFGYSVAIHGDAAIVGAYYEDTGGNNAGAAYIYRYNGSSWEEEVKLMASDAEEGDNFGHSVAIYENMAIVGAHYEDTGADAAGAAYIYLYNGINWAEKTKLQSGNIDAYGRFGYSVAMDDSVAVVGAPYEDTGGTVIGAVYIYRYSGTSWTEEQVIQASDKENYDSFGNSVSISGDAVIVGAYYEDTGGSDAGAAYVFHYDGSSWSEKAKLVAGDSEGSDWFGKSVSIDGDAAVIGAYGEDTDGNQTGSAYIFKYNGIDWSEVKKIQASDKQASDWFGYSVSLSGNAAIVGAHYEDTGGSNAGAAYAFDISSV